MQKRIKTIGTVCQSVTLTYLGWKCVSLHAVLGAKLIIKSIVYVYLMETITVRQRTARYVYGCLHAIVIGHSVIASSEDNTMTRIAYDTANLPKKNRNKS